MEGVDMIRCIGVFEMIELVKLLGLLNASLEVKM